ncbi:tetratricopeptide repeat protein [Streptomyces sp. NBC_00158]|uniref:tetratricopeptide repeat protein n=1 Tax=Streptomyces sp. NBC_00158 TaxID=2903627 RepID=UPI00324783D7
MDAAALDQRTRTHRDGVPPDLVERLLDLGHADLVREQALAEDGDWYCARAWARRLAGQGRTDEALAVVARYTATGWFTAVAEAARLLDATGRGEEAIGMLRPFAAAGERSALAELAPLLARHGRAEEAYALLVPHIADWYLAEALADVALVLGRGDEVAERLAARTAPDRPCGRCGGPECAGRGPEPFNAVNLLASVRERQGRTGEALAVLYEYGATPVNNRDPLAELLVKHGRIAELRAYAADGEHPQAVRRLAEHLEEQGDVAGAVEVYRPHAAQDFGHARTLLAQLLARHGRGGEAIEVMRAHDTCDDYALHLLCGLFAAEGRAEEGLAHLDGLRSRRGEEEWELFRLRGPLLAACGRLDEAVEQVRAHPEGATWYAVEELGRLLAASGRPEEAVAVLETDRTLHRRDLAPLLVDLGRPEEAVALLRTPLPEVPLPAPGDYSECPPF